MLPNSLNHKPDLDFINWARLKNSDPNALGYFYDTYVQQLFLEALRITHDREQAKDALQEVFLELWRYRKTLSDISNIKAYLFKVLKNILLKKWKTDNLFTYFQDEHSVISIEENIEETIIFNDIHKETSGRLHRAVSHLTKRQKAILQLHFYEGLSYKQIAEKLCMNQQSVNNLVFRTMLRLRNQMYSLICIVIVLVTDAGWS